MKTIFAILIFTIIFSNLSLAQEQINLLDPRFLWLSPNPETNIEFAESKLIISSTISSSGIYNLLPLNFSAKKYDLLIIEMKTTKDGMGEVSWRAKGESFSKNRSYPFYLRKADAFHTYYLNLKPYIKSAVVGQLLFFPFPGPGKADLKTFKLVKGSFGEKLLAGWQEVWGPEGREFTGKTFLVIKAPKFFGRSIFLYLNWLIAITIVISLLTKRPRWTVTFILALWILLEISSGVNNWNFFRKDVKFWGKSLEEKREMQNFKDFYRFIKFAEARIPPEASFALITSPEYRFSVERASYYLYPRQRQEQQAAYILLFDKMPNQAVLKTYKVIEKYREGAYILKSK